MGHPPGFQGFCYIAMPKRMSHRFPLASQSHPPLSPNPLCHLGSVVQVRCRRQKTRAGLPHWKPTFYLEMKKTVQDSSLIQLVSSKGVFFSIPCSKKHVFEVYVLASKERAVSLGGAKKNTWVTMMIMEFPNSQQHLPTSASVIHCWAPAKATCSNRSSEVMTIIELVLFRLLFG